MITTQTVALITSFLFFFPPNLFLLPTVHWSCHTSISQFIRFPPHFPSDPPWPCTSSRCLKPFIIVAIPVCPRSVSCQPMGSVSFKALQAQPLPHCRSQDRSLSRETVSSSSKTVRRRTTGSAQVSPPLFKMLANRDHVIVFEH